MLSKLRDLLDEFINWIDPDEQNPLAESKAKYTRDCTPLNQYHYDFIMAAYTEFREFNEGKSRSDKKTVIELTDKLNDHFGLDKSTRSYQRIWSGQLTREELPQGKLDFEW